MQQSLAFRQAERLRAINQELVSRIQAAPPEAWNRRQPGTWSAGEVIGHMIEMEPFWARTAVELARRPGLQVGRATEDPGRLAGPRSGADLDPSQGSARLMAAGQEAMEFLRDLSDEAWNVEGRRRDGEPITVGAIVERLLVDHAEEHARQIQAALTGTGGR